MSTLKTANVKCQMSCQMSCQTSFSNRAVFHLRSIISASRLSCTTASLNFLSTLETSRGMGLSVILFVLFLLKAACALIVVSNFAKLLHNLDEKLQFSPKIELKHAIYHESIYLSSIKLHNKLCIDDLNMFCNLFWDIVEKGCSNM